MYYYRFGYIYECNFLYYVKIRKIINIFDLFKKKVLWFLIFINVEFGVCKISGFLFIVYFVLK